MFRPCVPALILSAASVLAAQAPSPEGRWEGTLELPGASLKVGVDLAFQQGAWMGRISIPEQGAKDLPLDKVTVNDRGLSFILPGVPGNPSFAGTFSPDGSAVSGLFTQGARQLPLRLARTVRGADKARQALQGFETVIEEIRKAWKVPGLAVAVVKDGEVVFSKGVGHRDLARGLPMTPDTLQPIGSSSKAFTTAVMASLVEEGKLAWDKPVRTWMPWFALEDPFATDRMTPLDLVTHRSGMPRHDAVWYNATAGRKELVRRLKHLEPNKDFRTDYQYNNLMFLTAGVLIEEITGKSWEENVRERIFKPLGMVRSNFSVELTQKDGNASRPYREEKDGTVKEIPYRVIENIGPAGSINATANELANWVLLHLSKGRFAGKQVLEGDSVGFLHTPRTLLGQPQIDPEVLPVGYAPGWFTEVYRGHPVLHHGGAIDGFIAMVEFIPDSDLGIVILSNLDGCRMPLILPRIIVDRVLGFEAKDWCGAALRKKKETDRLAHEAVTKKQLARKPGTSPSHPLADYIGPYEHPGYGVFEVREAGGRLEARYNRIEAPLEHWHYNVFNALRGPDPLLEDAKIQFHLGVDGDVESLSILLEPAARPIVFTRKAEPRMFDPDFLRRLTGTYALRPEQEGQVLLQGSVLVVEIKGQGRFELVPVRGTRFNLKGQAQATLTFELPKEGPATAVALEQPGGIFRAARK